MAWFVAYGQDSGLLGMNSKGARSTACRVSALSFADCTCWRTSSPSVRTRSCGVTSNCLTLEALKGEMTSACNFFA